jgi:hypothetical protein
MALLGPDFVLMLSPRDAIARETRPPSSGARVPVVFIVLDNYSK